MVGRGCSPTAFARLALLGLLAGTLAGALAGCALSRRREVAPELRERADAGARAGPEADAGAAATDDAPAAGTPGSPCAADGDCLAPPASCKRAACIEELCQEVSKADGRPLPASEQPVGTCVERVCDGRGGIVERFDDRNLPLSTEACRLPRCTASGPDSEPAVQGSLAPGAFQQRGDCKQLACDGRGGALVRPDPDDVPLPDDGCQRTRCDGAEPVRTTLPTGARCAEGSVCGADGVCFACVSSDIDIDNPDGALPPCPAVEFDAVDLLFVVDNSGTMREEQQALRAQFPRLIGVLTSGDRDGDGERDFPPITDLHLGVVSSDMGLSGVDGVPGCGGDSGVAGAELGDDGRLRHMPGSTAVGCAGSYPSFLGYQADGSADVDPDVGTAAELSAQLATDLGCIATLGTEGCGFEQPLESMLKALWPAADARVSFLPNRAGQGALGHGDGRNAGFQRGAGERPSLLAVVVVSDEDDCSSWNTAHFTPDAQLALDDPLRGQPMNLRCMLNPDNLYPVERYVDGLRELRQQVEPLVIFSAIVGVPVERVDADARAELDPNDPQALEAFYRAILDDPRMQEASDPTRSAGSERLTPVCESPTSLAFPGRRFVELTRQFGAQGVLQSICQSDFSPAMDALIEAVVRAR